MRNKVQEGKILSWTNDTGADVASGDFVIINGRVGVACGDIADGAQGSVEFEGVFEGAASTAVTIEVGDPLYIKGTGTLSNVRPGGGSYAGRAVEAKASAGTTVKVRLGEESINALGQSTAAQFVATTAAMVGVSGSGNNAAPLTTTETRLDKCEAALALHDAILKKLGMRNY